MGTTVEGTVTQPANIKMVRPSIVRRPFLMAAPSLVDVAQHTADACDGVGLTDNSPSGGRAVDADRKMIGRIVTLGIFTTFMLAGCQSTGAGPLDQDSYFIGNKDGSPGIGVSLSNKAAVYREANDFCRKKGLEVKTLNITVTPAMPAR